MGVFTSRSVLFIISIFLAQSGFTIQGQGLNEEESEIKNTIDSFFKALEKQDSALFRDITLTDGQVWSLIKDGDNVRYGMRYFEDDIKRFNPETVIYETPLDYEIKVHNGIAVAWVPYTLSVNTTFSHCGVDIFTLFRVDTGWKILNISFTVEPDGCEALE